MLNVRGLVEACVTMSSESEMLTQAVRFSSALLSAVGVASTSARDLYSGCMTVRLLPIASKSASIVHRHQNYDTFLDKPFSPSVYDSMLTH